MNLVKNSVALLAFSLVTIILLATGQENWAELQSKSILYFLLSGFFGLGIGDWFLLKGFQRIGSARAILVFSFQPLLLSLEGFLFFNQELTKNQGIAIFFMTACVWTISYEKFKESGHWEWQGILYSIVGVLLDNIGVVLSRKGFDLSPGISAFGANTFRAAASLPPFICLAYLYKEKFWHSFRILPLKFKLQASSAGFFGTFLSLTCWLTALKIGHIGSLAAVGSFNPVAAAIWEWLLNKKRPTKFLVIALILFLIGFLLLLQ